MNISNKRQGIPKIPSLKLAALARVTSQIYPRITINIYTDKLNKK